MPCGTHKILKVPDDKVDQVVADSQLDGPKSVTKTQETDGTWTVTSVFSPCTDGSPQTTTKTYGG